MSAALVVVYGLSLKVKVKCDQLLESSSGIENDRLIKNIHSPGAFLAYSLSDLLSLLSFFLVVE